MPAEVPERILDGLWRRYPDLPRRPDETGTEFVARLRARGLWDVPEPIRTAMRALARLASAVALERITGVGFGELMGEATRN